jgi:formylmethanofuran dehydrogenase subunit B
MSLTIVKHATCTFCGCVCDDIELHAEGEKIVKTKNACSLGESWFKNHTAERLYPDALIDGHPATVDDAVEVAAEYLYQANMPLVYGLSNVTCETQRNAVSLAELIGGVIDSHTSL